MYKTVIVAAILAGAGFASSAQAMDGVKAGPTRLNLVSAAEFGVPLTGNLRLHINQAPPSDNPLDSDLLGHVRPSLGGSMVDLYPLGTEQDGGGFYLSGGARFYNRNAVRVRGAERMVSLMYMPRSLLIKQSRKLTPALSMGYSRSPMEGMAVRFEVGAQLGHMDQQGYRMSRLAYYGRKTNDGAQIDEVARVAMAFRF